MSTYILRRFAHVDGLKSIAINHLHSLLSSYDSYLHRRGFTLTHSVDAVNVDEWFTKRSFIISERDDEEEI